MSLVTSPQLARMTALFNAVGLASVNHAGRAALKRLVRDKIRVEADGLVLQGPMDSRRVLTQIACDTFEPFEVELFKHAVRPGMTVVDVGANIGFYTLIAARLVGASGRVYAFEPDPRTLGSLRANVRANRFGNVTVLPSAASGRAEQRTFHLSRTAAHSGLHRPPGMDRLAATTSVRTVIADDVLASQTVDVIKIDVEGEEPAVLRGLSRTLGSNPDVRLFIEFSPAALDAAGVVPSLFLEELRSAFRSVLVVDEERRRLVPTGPGGPTGRVNLYLRGYQGGGA